MSQYNQMTNQEQESTTAADVIPAGRPVAIATTTKLPTVATLVRPICSVIIQGLN